MSPVFEEEGRIEGKRAFVREKILREGLRRKYKRPGIGSYVLTGAKRGDHPQSPQSEEVERGKTPLGSGVKPHLQSSGFPVKNPSQNPKKGKITEKKNNIRLTCQSRGEKSMRKRKKKHSKCTRISVFGWRKKKTG